MNRVARLSSVLRIAVTVLAWLILLATIPVLVWAILYGDVDLAQDVTVPVSSLPLLPVMLFIVLFTVRSALMVVALFSLRRILNHFGREQFFTRDCVAAFRRIGLQLVALALVDVFTPVLAILALITTEPRFNPSDISILQWVLINFPFMSLMGGLFALIMAHVLGQAADLAEDAALTV